MRNHFTPCSRHRCVRSAGSAHSAGVGSIPDPGRGRQTDPASSVDPGRSVVAFVMKSAVASSVQSAACRAPVRPNGPNLGGLCRVGMRVSSSVGSDPRRFSPSGAPPGLHGADLPTQGALPAVRVVWLCRCDGWPGGPAQRVDVRSVWVVDGDRLAVRAPSRLISLGGASSEARAASTIARPCAAPYGAIASSVARFSEGTSYRPKASDVESGFVDLAGRRCRHRVVQPAAPALVISRRAEAVLVLEHGQATGPTERPPRRRSTHPANGRDRAGRTGRGPAGGFAARLQCALTTASSASGSSETERSWSRSP